MIELTMKAATLSVPVLELISICMDTRGLPEWARYIGIVLAISGDMVFMISVWTMKDSWRAGVSKTDQTELVTVFPHTAVFMVPRVIVYRGCLMKKL